MTTERVAVVLVHGLFSSASAWIRFDTLIAEDDDLAQADLLHFSYSSPKITLNPLRRIPNFNDIADSLAVYLEIEAGG